MQYWNVEINKLKANATEIIGRIIHLLALLPGLTFH